MAALSPVLRPPASGLMVSVTIDLKSVLWKTICIRGAYAIIVEIAFVPEVCGKVRVEVAVSV
jgi:hypothetical protein